MHNDKNLAKRRLMIAKSTLFCKLVQGPHGSDSAKDRYKGSIFQTIKCHRVAYLE